MDNSEEIAVTKEAIETYMDNCEKILEGYLNDVAEVESLQEFIDMNMSLALGYMAAFDALRTTNESTH
jgi:hypothetical protein